MFRSQVRNSILTNLVFLLLIFGSVKAFEGPQTVYDKNVTFTITASGKNNLHVSASVYEQMTCLNLRKTEDRMVLLYEPGHGKISRLKSTLNRKPLGGQYRSTESYQGGDVFLSDAKVHYLWYPETPKVNDQLAYQFEQDFENIGYLPILHIKNVDSQSTYHVVFNHPADVTVDLDIFVSHPEVKYTIDKPSDKVTSLHFRPIGKTDPLAGYPFNDLHAMVIPVVRTDRTITPSTPERFLEWYSSSVDLRPRLQPARQLPWLDSIGQLPTPIDKLRALHDWVRTNIRYVFDSREDHSIFPHAPTYVVDLSFGDCKDRAYLICALAKELGIDVYMGLVSTELEPPMTALHIGLFNHVICYYRDGERDVFFDATARHHGFEDPPETIIGHPALILDPAAPRVIPVTAEWDQPAMEFSFDAHIDSLAVAQAKIILRRDQLATIQYNQAEQTNYSLQEALTEFVATCLPQVIFTRCEIIESKPREVTVAAVADLSRLSITTPSSRYLTRTPLTFGVAELIERASDSLPVYNSKQLHIKADLDLRGATLSGEQDSLSFGEPVTGQYRASCSVRENGLYFAFEIRRSAKFLEGDAKATYLDFWRRYLSEKKNMYVLVGDTK